MPTYHYRCTQCEQHLEVVQRMTDEPLTTCAACGGEMAKVLKPIGIVLKGSGFYRTDNRGASKKPAETKTAETKPAETKTADSKPAESTSSSSPSESKSATA